MKSSDVFASKYLSAADLRDRDATVTIERVEIEKMPSGEKKPALFFEGKAKGFLLNRTNFNTIAEVLGADDTDDWSGRSITLYPTETEFQGRMVDCIRVRRRKAPAAPEWQEPAPPPIRETEPADLDDNEVPF